MSCFHNDFFLVENVLFDFEQEKLFLVSLSPDSIGVLDLPFLFSTGLS